MAGRGYIKSDFQALSTDGDMENLSIDSTSIRVHESANGGKKSEVKAVGRSRGGLTTKIHAIVDGLGNPVVFLLSPGKELLPDTTDLMPLSSPLFISLLLSSGYFRQLLLIFQTRPNQLYAAIIRR